MEEDLDLYYANVNVPHMYVCITVKLDIVLTYMTNVKGNRAHCRFNTKTFSKLSRSYPIAVYGVEGMTLSLFFFHVPSDMSGVGLGRNTQLLFQRTKLKLNRSLARKHLKMIECLAYLQVKTLPRI